MSSEDQPDSHRQDRSGIFRSLRMNGPRSEDRDIALEDKVYRETGGLSQHSRISLCDALGDLADTDDFQREVAKTSNAQEISHQEAEIVVYTKLLIQKHGTKDKALLYVVSEEDFKETQVLVLINNLIHRGAYTSAADENKKTPLHFAAKKNWKGVAAKLLENNANTDKRDADKALPLQIAYKNRYDRMCALLMAYMQNSFVRSLFISQEGSKQAELSFHTLIRSNMQRMIISALDCMIETKGTIDQIRVYYNVLESDESGNTPHDKDFDFTQRSPLQIISKQGNKNIVYHDAVRLLIRKKWNEFARSKIQINSFIYMLSLIALSFSVIVAVMTENPAIYDSPLQIARAVTEIFCLCMIVMTLFTELNQLWKHKLEYFTDASNWFDMSSSVLLLIVPAFRFTNTNAQWHIYAFGFLFWVIRIFKYAEVFRQTGAYVQILGRVIVNDFVQFGVVFSVVLLAFSGSFYLALRGDKDLDVHSETSTFWGILFVGVRTLSEAQPVVDYTGGDGYSTISTIFMVLFLFTCCVILLNILIAQLSDTYHKVQQDAQRGLEVNRAWIVARVELNSLFVKKDFRKTRYEEFEDIPDLGKVLEKWESPPLNEMNKYVRDIWDSLDSHKMNLLTIQQRMSRQENALREMQSQQENALHKMQEQMALLVSLQTGKAEPIERVKKPRPTFYRSETELDTVESGVTSEDIQVEITAHEETLEQDAQESTS